MKNIWLKSEKLQTKIFGAICKISIRMTEFVEKRKEIRILEEHAYV